MSNAAEEAAAALVPGMVSDLVQAMPLASEDQLAADLAARSDAAAPAPPAPSSQPQTPEGAAPAPPAAAEPVVEEEFDIDPVISDELQQLLDEPDFEEEAELQVAAEQDDGEIDYSTDPEVAKRLRALENRNAWLEDQRVRNEKKKWVAENLKAYPLLARYAADEVAAIDATSRRAFARQAATLHGRLAKMVAPALAEIAEAKKVVRQEVTQEVRADYRDNGWGVITAGPATVPVEASEEAAEYTTALKSGNLPAAIGALLRGHGVTNKGG